MAIGKKSFILYSDQRYIFEKLNNEQAGQLIKHIFAYVNDENPESDFVTELAFESIKQSLKRDLKKWEKQHEQRVKAGKKSAEIRKRDLTSVNDRLRASTVSDSVSGSVNDSDNVKEKRKVFTKPTLNELQDYIKEKGYTTIDAQHFLDYYESNGWMVGKNKMKNWEATVNNWEKRNNPKATTVLKEISKITAYTILKDPKMLQAKLDEGYTKEQIENYAK